MKRCIFKCFDLHMSFCTLVFFTLHHLHRSKTPSLVHILKRREREVDLRAPSQDFPGARVAKTLWSQNLGPVLHPWSGNYISVPQLRLPPHLSQKKIFFLKSAFSHPILLREFTRVSSFILKKMYLTKASISIQKLSIHPHPTRE